MNHSVPPLKLGVCGLGTVASGLIELITQNPARISDRAGRPLSITRIASRTPRPARMPAHAEFSTDLAALIDDPEVDVVVELIGGVEPAHSLIERALELGKPVVTANKEVLARHGDALFLRASARGVPIGFEASVGGGIPIIKAVRESLGGDEISRIVGIVNGTTNFILSRMDEDGASFEDALAEAKALGYAEAVPDYDIEGVDAAHKVAILASLAWGIPFDVGEVHMQGIAGIDRDDLAFARRLGYVVRHLGLAQKAETHIETCVFPALVPKSNLLGSVCGVTNAVEVTSRALGKSLFIGAGAGALPTANSVLSDVLDIANGRSVKRLPSHGRERVADSQSCATYYLRAQADDKTGVLARLTDLLAGQGIGIDALLQPEIDAALGSPSAASIVLITHATEESRMRQAVSRIQAIPEIRGPVSLIRVFEGE
ncbi:MAG: homoserine dehydrogenase [Gammaproteobacteria bacterium]|nr:homoserine dehydrogenase [Gammaproteobacteria bacterium]MCY4323676.1 homoserine dehydrogenase [Gammaproteobacteria bacterium]